MTVDLPLGKQELIARHPDFPKKSETVTIESGTAGESRVSASRAQPLVVSKAQRARICLGKIREQSQKSFLEQTPSKKKPESIALPRRRFADRTDSPSR